MIVPKGITAITKLYGNPRTHSFEAKMIVSFDSPNFMVRGPFRVRCHKSIADELEGIFKEIAALELTLHKPLIRDYGGCYVYRTSRTTNKLSTHAWGIAVDLNVGTNPLGHNPLQSQAMVKVFTDKGWVWGGNWKHPDGMHFQRAEGY